MVFGGVQIVFGLPRNISGHARIIVGQEQIESNEKPILPGAIFGKNGQAQKGMIDYLSYTLLNLTYGALPSHETHGYKTNVFKGRTWIFKQNGISLLAPNG